MIAIVACPRRSWTTFRVHARLERECGVRVAQVAQPDLRHVRERHGVDLDALDEVLVTVHGPE